MNYAVSACHSKGPRVSPSDTSVTGLQVRRLCSRLMNQENPKEIHMRGKDNKSLIFPLFVSFVTCSLPVKINLLERKSD
jgi:hypothetical protein